MGKAQFKPGFRISITDFLVLIAGAIGSSFVTTIDLQFGLAIAFTVGHFFLFCNVIRMPRYLELIWAAVFILLSLCSIEMHSPEWLMTFGISFGVTIMLVTIQMRHPSYHGVGWDKVNPNLSQWWEVNGHDL
jgi:hypothetical protein